jgi:hypothetical protein
MTVVRKRWGTMFSFKECYAKRRSSLVASPGPSVKASSMKPTAGQIHGRMGSENPRNGRLSASCLLARRGAKLAVLAAGQPDACALLELIKESFRFDPS